MEIIFSLFLVFPVLSLPPDAGREEIPNFDEVTCWNVLDNFQALSEKYQGYSNFIYDSLLKSDERNKKETADYGTVVP